MAELDYDLFVIGGGSGGVRAARVAAELGHRVAIAEEYRYGGTCVIRGCVPKKLLVYASEYGDSFTDARGYGWTCGEVAFDWRALIASKDREIERLSQAYRGRMERAGVAVMQGRAVLADAHTVEIGDRRVTARTILIATGATPLRLDVPGGELAITSNEAFHLPELPERVVLVGGGYIGVEFAHIFAGLGARTTLVHRGGRVLGGFDDDLRQAATDALRARGVELHLREDVRAIERLPSGALEVHLSGGARVEADAVMCAIGRVPSTAHLGLEHAGVRLGDAGQILVDAFSRTCVGHIYAIGDCTSRVNLTPVAIREAQAFVDTVFGGRPTRVDHDHLPTAVFGLPPIGTVGLTEAEARERFGRIDIYRTSFRPLVHTLSGRAQTVMMKLVVDGGSQRVLGAHMLGVHAAEIIQSVAIAIRMGATKADFDATLAVHPTTAEEFVLMRQKIS